MVTATTIDSVTAARIMALLDTVPDPEIPAVTLTDLGIVRGLRNDPPAVLLTPTYTGCPATHVIAAMVREALDAAGYRAIGIETLLSPPWTTDWISKRGRQRLHDYGIAPPGAPGDRHVPCPQCGSTRTREVSRFGSTPCKALWRCGDCAEPFEQFKCH